MKFVGLLLLAPGLATGGLQVTETGKAITITRGEVPVLVYHKAEVEAPAGADPAYRRSGHIHPLYSPSGEPVTGTQPRDHYHHMGLWHAWVKTRHGEDTPDFWNLKKKTGRVRHAGTVSLQQPGEDRPGAGFVVTQEHVAYKGREKKETVVLRERFEVRARYVEGRNVISYGVVQENVSGDSLLLPVYHYGGCLAYRAPHHWGKDNSDYLTSEGLTRADSHATRAKWVAIHGPTKEGPASVAFLFHPGNHDFPQRLRTWPGGPVFLSVVPTQEHPWEIKPGAKIAMNYEIVVTDGKATAEGIEGWWKEYARP